VNVGIEDPGQCELAAPVDHVIARVRGIFSRLADPGNTAVLDDDRAVADDPAARIDRDEIVDIGNDPARRRATNSWMFFGN
jgi:hypothetical protein